MSNQQRIEDLKAYVDEWELALTNLSIKRERLLLQQDLLFEDSDSSLKEDLREKILTTDAAVIEHHKILIRMQSLLGLAENGHDV